MTDPEAELVEAPPIAGKPTDYDWAHRICYLRLLDADAEGAPWQEVARTVLKLDPDADPDRVRATWASRLDRAKWMALYATTYGQQEPVAELIPAMLAGFLKSDRAFARARTSRTGETGKQGDGRG